MHESETREALRWNTGRGGMKWLMKEAAARHTESERLEFLAANVGRTFWSMAAKGGSGPRREAGLGGYGVERPGRRKDWFRGGGMPEVRGSGRKQARGKGRGSRAL